MCLQENELKKIPLQKLPSSEVTVNKVLTKVNSEEFAFNLHILISNKILSSNSGFFSISFFLTQWFGDL